jgi:hypothetical protein
MPALSVDGRSTPKADPKNPSEEQAYADADDAAATFDLIRLAVTDLRDQRAGPGNNSQGCGNGRSLAGRTVTPMLKVRAGAARFSVGPA